MVRNWHTNNELEVTLIKDENEESLLWWIRHVQNGQSLHKNSERITINGAKRTRDGPQNDWKGHLRSII